MTPAEILEREQGQGIIRAPPDDARARFAKKFKDEKARKDLEEKEIKRQNQIVAELDRSFLQEQCADLIAEEKLKRAQAEKEAPQRARQAKHDRIKSMVQVTTKWPPAAPGQVSLDTGALVEEPPIWPQEDIKPTTIIKPSTKTTSVGSTPAAKPPSAADTSISITIGVTSTPAQLFIQSTPFVAVPTPVASSTPAPAATVEAESIASTLDPSRLLRSAQFQLKPKGTAKRGRHSTSSN